MTFVWWNTQLGGLIGFLRNKTWIYNCDYLPRISLHRALKSQLRKRFVYYLALVLAIQIQRLCCRAWGKFTMWVDLSQQLGEIFNFCFVRDEKHKCLSFHFGTLMPGGELVSQVQWHKNHSCAVSSCFSRWHLPTWPFPCCTAVYSASFQASSSRQYFLPAGLCFLCFRSTLPHWL